MKEFSSCLVSRNVAEHHCVTMNDDDENVTIKIETMSMDRSAGLQFFHGTRLKFMRIHSHAHVVDIGTCEH